MTPRAERRIDVLLRQREDGVELGLLATAQELRLAGLDPSEAGWILRHVFGLEMAEAVHMATVCAGELPSPPASRRR